MNIQQYQRIHDAVNKSGTPDISKGLSGWQCQAQTVRGAILEARRQVDEEKAELSKVYNAEETKRRAASLESTYEGIARLGVEKLEAGLEAVINAKREQFKKIALTAPSDEQLRLLQSMSMRDDLTDGEIAAVAADMAGNLQALKALGSIARKTGHDFPKIVTAEEMESDLNAAEQFSRNMLHSIETPEDDLQYNQKCFWSYRDVGLPKATYDKLDHVLYAAVQLQPVEDTRSEQPAKEKPTEPPKPLPVVHVTDGVDNLEWLSARYGVKKAAIIAENPDAGLDRVKSTDRLPADLALTITPSAEYAAQTGESA